MVTLSENQELIEVASSGIAALDPDQRKVASLLHALSSPDVSLLVLGVFAILIVAVAYMAGGIIIFAIFAKK